MRSSRRSIGVAVATAVLLVPLLGLLAIPSSDDEDGGDGAADRQDQDGDPAVEQTRTTTPPVSLPFRAKAKTAYAFAFTYSPGDVTATVGELVVFENRDDVAHTFTDDAGRFDSDQVEPGERYGFAYSSPGTYTFHCELHPTMRGAVYVEPQPQG